MDSYGANKKLTSFSSPLTFTMHVMVGMHVYTSTQHNHCCQGQELVTKWVRCFRGEATTITLLDEHSSKTNHKGLLLYP